MATLAEQIGERARAARLRLGLNQADIAERVGISNAVYGRLERGLVTPRLATLMKLCDVLRLSPNDLLVEKPNASLRNDGLTQSMRQVVSLLENSDAETLRRVTTMIRWIAHGHPQHKSKR